MFTLVSKADARMATLGSPFFSAQAWVASILSRTRVPRPPRSAAMFWGLGFDFCRLACFLTFCSAFRRSAFLFEFRSAFRGLAFNDFVFFLGNYPGGWA